MIRLPEGEIKQWDEYYHTLKDRYLRYLHAIFQKETSLASDQSYSSKMQLLGISGKIMMSNEVDKEALKQFQHFYKLRKDTFISVTLIYLHEHLKSKFRGQLDDRSESKQRYEDAINNIFESPKRIIKLVLRLTISTEAAQYMKDGATEAEGLNIYFQEHLNPSNDVSKLKEPTQIKADQTVLLFHYLREFNFIDKNITNSKLSIPLEQLSGFSSKQLRKRFSKIHDIEKKHKDSIIDLLQEMLDSVKNTNN